MKFYFMTLALFMASTSHAKSLKIMQYNTENFFDTKHDEGTDDYTYLPSSLKAQIPDLKQVCSKLGTEFYINQCLHLDWNEARFTKKITNISKVIKSFDSTGMGPDIVVLQEIENKNVLTKLVSKGLDKLGYQHQVLIEGDDSRGIDIAILSKYPVKTAKRHPIFVKGTKLNTRGILEVEVTVDGKDVAIFGNHWPSQHNPTEERLASAELLASLAERHNSHLIVALGDFNTLDTDAPSPFGHLVNFKDAEKEARKVQTSLNPGTHFFKGKWSSLDKIFVHNSSSALPNYAKFQILNHSFMMKQDQRSGFTVPNRFDTETGEGFSDHLPIGLEIQL